MNRSLPLFNEDKSNPERNLCGECRACCVVLPIAEPELVKPAGEPCKHLCGSGCELYNGPQFPRLCKDYLCLWRQDDWLNNRPDYRPDKLGVIFQLGARRLIVFETRPGALQSQQVAYIKSRMRKWLGEEDVVKNFPAGVMDGVHIAPSDVHNGQSDLNPETHEWVYEGGNEVTLHRKPGRLPVSEAGTGP